jgi:hypothetical protein
MVRKGGLEPPCLLGATPSRWCVCQFHHFRTRALCREQYTSRLGAGNREPEACSAEPEAGNVKPGAGCGSGRAREKFFCAVVPQRFDFIRCDRAARIGTHLIPKCFDPRTVFCYGCDARARQSARKRLEMPCGPGRISIGSWRADRRLGCRSEARLCQRAAQPGLGRTDTSYGIRQGKSPAHENRAFLIFQDRTGKNWKQEESEGWTVRR